MQGNPNNTTFSSQSSDPEQVTHRSPWRIAAYRRVWLSTVIISLAFMCERIAFGWLVLLETDSVFLTAASFAVQKVPTTIFAPIAGDISDRMSRSKVLATTALVKAVIVISLAMLLSGNHHQLWMIFTMVALSGIGQTFITPSTQGLITDIVPKHMAMKAVALQSTGARGVGALGSLFGGLAIASFGVPMALYAVGCVFLIGALAMATMPQYGKVQLPSKKINLKIVPEATSGLISLMRLPVVRTLLIIALTVEIFAFAYHAVMPSMARYVLNIDADGLGTLTLMAGIGAVIGVATLTAIGYYSRLGMLLIGVTITFGLMLIAFASSGILPLSLFLIMGVGAMAAVFDALQWTLLQQHVPETMRGRAIGGWVFIISFGWIGQLTIGAVAELVGVQWALGGAGGLVVMTGILAYIFSQRLRTA
jgi:MFS family permease